MSACIRLTMKDLPHGYDERTYCSQCDGNLRNGDLWKNEEYVLLPDGCCYHAGVGLDPNMKTLAHHRRELHGAPA